MFFFVLKKKKYLGFGFRFVRVYMINIGEVNIYIDRFSGNYKCIDSGIYSKI